MGGVSLGELYAVDGVNCCEPHEVNILPLTADYTISYDLLRETFPSGRNDWATDISTIYNSDWTLSPHEGDPGICIWYLRGSNLGLTIQSQNMASFNVPEEVTVGRWFHMEIHRQGTTNYTFCIDNKVVLTHISSTQSTVSRLNFFNHGGGGGNLKHGGYLKNLRIYNNWKTETLGPIWAIYQNKYIYGIKKEVI